MSGLRERSARGLADRILTVEVLKPLQAQALLGLQHIGTFEGQQQFVTGEQAVGEGGELTRIAVDRLPVVGRSAQTPQQLQQQNHAQRPGERLPQVVGCFEAVVLA